MGWIVNVTARHTPPDVSNQQITLKWDRCPSLHANTDFTVKNKKNKTQNKKTQQATNSVTETTSLNVSRLSTGLSNSWPITFFISLQIVRAIKWLKSLDYFTLLPFSVCTQHIGWNVIEESNYKIMAESAKGGQRQFEVSSPRQSLSVHRELVRSVRSRLQVVRLGGR